jgi:hypothetical protein
MTDALKSGRPQNQVIELHFENHGGRVRIVGPDNHVMIQSVEAAVEACRAYSGQMLFKTQFDQLLEKLGQWMEANATRVNSGYLTTQDSGLLFLVVTESRQYDDAVESALTELDLEIAQDSDFDLINLGVHAIPNASKDTVDSFVSSKMALRFVRNGHGG